MIREKNEREHRELIIDLSGPEGNAFVLMGYASRFAKRLGLNEQTILEEMKAGDYENLLRTFDKYFGHFVILQR